MCNFISSDSFPNDFMKNYKIVYRHYATLYFIFLCEETESELGILDLIQVFVETLDKCFSSVCELDLIYQADKIHHILDEIVMGGLVLETDITHIIFSINEAFKYEKSSVDNSLTSLKKSKMIVENLLNFNRK